MKEGKIMSRQVRMNATELRKNVQALFAAERSGDEDAFDELWDDMSDAFGDDVAEVTYREELALKAEGLL